MRKIWDIPGGVHPTENKTQSMAAPLGNVSLPAEIILPLNQHIGAPAEPVVSVGEHVLTGQLIASAKGPVSAALHASTSGTVTAIEPRLIAHPSGMDARCIVIEPDGLDQWIELQPCEDYMSLERETLLEKIRQAGIAGMGGAGFPAAVKLNPRPQQAIDSLIINGTECEPYITADDMLMQTCADEVVAGTLLLAQLLGQPQNILIGIEDNKPEAIAAVQKAAEGTTVEVVSFPTKYPSGGEKQLIQILTGQEVPSGAIPASIGIVCQNVASTVSAYRAVRHGRPLVSRITTVVGEALQSQRNIEVRLGTPLKHILSEHGFEPNLASRLVMGGPMMGFSLPSAEVPLVKTTNCILAPSKQELPAPPPAQACIRCGMCAEACPASLLPQQMFWYAQSEDYDKLEAHNIADCIECGACSFVCPSNIPLVQYYRAAKGTMRQQAIDKANSDRSRQRFEFRQERIAKEEAAKAAKREARKKAAEEAKRRMAEKQAAGVHDNSTDKADAVSAAMARVKAQQADPAEQQAKLERALTSAQGRLELAQKHLAEGQSENEAPEKIEKYQARIKQAQLRVDDNQKKLADFKAQSSHAQKTQAKQAGDAATDPVAAAIERAKAKAAMSPGDKLRSNVDSLNKRLQTAQEKLQKAKDEGSDKVDALATGVDKLQEKLSKSRQELAELDAATPQAAPAELDAAQAAIERAKAKAAAQAAMTPADKLQNTIDSLSKRLQTARGKLQTARDEGSDKADALALGVGKLADKLAAAEKELAALNPAPEAKPEPDAAQAAIEKAKAKAAAQAAMSPVDKLQSQIEATEVRLSKARERLTKAEAEADDNVEAFRTGVDKTEAKLLKLQAQLDAL